MYLQDYLERLWKETREKVAGVHGLEHETGCTMCSFDSFS